MNKILSLEKLSHISGDLKRSGKSTGLITGCFDIVHFEHMKLFYRIKQKVDVVFVGLDSDSLVKYVKGVNRPIFSYKERSSVIAALMFVDYVFEIRMNGLINEDSLERKHEKILEKLQPTYLITNSLADKYAERKKERAIKYHSTLLLLKTTPKASTTKILDKIYTLD